MATATVQPSCSQCDEERQTYICTGCSQTFCFEHLTDHREEINQQFNQIEDHSNSFRQIILDQKNDPNEYPLIEEINRWEKESIQIIQQTAHECREKIIKYTNRFLNNIENQLNEFTEQLKQIRQKKKFNEIDLYQLNEILTMLEIELYYSPNLSIEQQSTFFINNISVIIPFDKETTWKQTGITMAGGNSYGDQCNQLSSPYGISIDDDQTLFIADTSNNRIAEWQFNVHNGRIVAGENERGNQTNQLNEPTDVIVDQKNHSLIIADHENRRVMQWSHQNSTQHGEILLSDINCWGLVMDEDGSLYVSDCQKHEVKRYRRCEKEGTIVAGGNGKGDNLNQLNFPTFLFVDADHSLYVSDRDNHRVMKWIKDAEEGMVVAGGNGQGNNLTQVFAPQGIAIDPFGQIYVAEYGNDRVTRWCEGAKEGTIVVGGNGEGDQSNQLCGPRGLSFDHQGNLYVVDCLNHRIQKFTVD